MDDDPTHARRLARRDTFRIILRQKDVNRARQPVYTADKIIDSAVRRE